MYVADAAEGIILAGERFNGSEPVNRGSSFETCSFGRLRTGGQPRRKLDVSRAEQYFGFRARVAFEEGLRRTIGWYQTRVKQGVAVALQAEIV